VRRRFDCEVRGQSKQRRDIEQISAAAAAAAANAAAASAAARALVGAR
jgi:hypothetical protein